MLNKIVNRKVRKKWERKKKNSSGCSERERKEWWLKWMWMACRRERERDKRQNIKKKKSGEEKGDVTDKGEEKSESHFARNFVE